VRLTQPRTVQADPQASGAGPSSRSRVSLPCQMLELFGAFGAVDPCMTRSETQPPQQATTPATVGAAGGPTPFVRSLSPPSCQRDAVPSVQSKPVPDPIGRRGMPAACPAIGSGTVRLVMNPGKLRREPTPRRDPLRAAHDSRKFRARSTGLDGKFPLKRLISHSDKLTQCHDGVVMYSDAK